MRSRGRPRKKWVDNVLEDIKERGWKVRRVIDLARDRPKWRSFVRASSSVNTIVLTEEKKTKKKFSY